MMETDARGFPLGDMRVSDADRDRAVSELSEAFQVGRITSEELEERSGQVLAARTGRELSALLADLPVVPATADSVSPRRHSGFIVAASIAAAFFAISALGNAALSAGPTAQQREYAQEFMARQGLSVQIPPNPGFNWAGTLIPAAIAVALVVLIIFLRKSRTRRA
jgi:Domain of unknown function (DUF1707)